MTKKIYQIKIVLVDSKPKIWRRILVPSDILLSDFHLIIQTAMGWTNAHLHQFIKNRTYYTERMRDDDLWDEMGSVDYAKIKISDLLEKEKDTMVYVYDFGDNWEHELILEKIGPYGLDLPIPICLAGKNNCPPEDCGGTWGYYDILKILKDPNDEEYEDYVEWLGGEFDPKYFNLDEINSMLNA